MPAAATLTPADLRHYAGAEPYYAFPLIDVGPAGETFQRVSESSMVELKDGSVLIAFGRHKTGSDNAQGHIWGRTLNADGTPRDAERILIKAPEVGLNSMSPALQRLPDGRLGMAFSYRVSVKEASRRFAFSEDEGRTWSTPSMVGEGGYVTGCHDRLTVLRDGRLLAPLHVSVHGDWDDHYLQVEVARSDDGGATWTRSAPLRLPRVGWDDRPMECGCVEPGIAERADGSLLITLRTAMGTQYGSESFDRGESWSTPRSMEVISPQAPAHLSRIPGRDELLLIWTPNYDPRHSLGGERHTVLAGLSADGGHSWPHLQRKVLAHDPEHSIDYPSILYKGDELWVALRCSTGKNILQGLTSTRLMRVPMAWVDA